MSNPTLEIQLQGLPHVPGNNMRLTAFNYQLEPRTSPFHTTNTKPFKKVPIVSLSNQPSPLRLERAPNGNRKPALFPSQQDSTAA